jgi:hypothetical protein
VDLALIFKTPPRDPPNERLPEACYRDSLARIAASGLQVDESTESAKKLRELRQMYEPFLVALAAYFRFDLPPTASSEVAVDNWQRSAWQQRAPGIGALPVAQPGDHFS